MKIEQAASDRKTGMTVEEMERLLQVARENGATGGEPVVVRVGLGGRLRSASVEAGAPRKVRQGGSRMPGL